MVIGAVPREVAHGGTDACALLLRQARPEVERVGNAKAQKPAVEVLAALGLAHVDAEMPQAPDAKRAREPHAPNAEVNFLALHFALWRRMAAGLSLIVEQRRGMFQHFAGESGLARGAAYKA